MLPAFPQALPYSFRTPRFVSEDGLDSQCEGRDYSPCEGKVFHAFANIVTPSLDACNDASISEAMRYVGLQLVTLLCLWVKRHRTIVFLSFPLAD